MKSYTKIIPGKKTDACTVHYHEQTDPAAAYGHYLLSQGKGPRNPDFNSNYLVTQLVEALAGRQSESLAVLGEESRKTITGVQATLRSQDNFTLDSVIIKEKQCRIQQVSKAQEEAQIYFVHDDGNVELVTASKGGQSSSETSPSINEYGRSLEGVRYIFLAVGGLTSRVTPGQISTLLSSITDYEAFFMLDKFARLIQTPKEKVRELRKETLYDILHGKMRALPPEHEVLLELIFKGYGRDQEITDRVDEAVPLQDTGLMLIDVEDRTSALVAQGQASFKASVESIEQLAQEVGAFRARYEEAERRGGEFKKLLQQRDEAVKQWEKQYQELRMEGMKEKALLEGQLKAKERELGPLAERLDRKNKEHDRERESWNKEKVELKEREQRMFAEREHWPRDFTDRYERAQRELTHLVKNLEISPRPAGINDEQRKALVASKEIIQKYRATTSGAPKSPTTVREEPTKADGAPHDGAPPKRSRLKRWGLGTLLLTGIVVGGYYVQDYYVEKNRPKFAPRYDLTSVSASAKNDPDFPPPRLDEEGGQKVSAASTAGTLPPSLLPPSMPERILSSGKRAPEDEGLSILIDGGRKPSYAPGDLLFGSFSSNDKGFDYSNCKSDGSLPAMLRGNNFTVIIPASWKKNEGSIGIMCENKEGRGEGVDISLNIEQNSPGSMAPVPAPKKSLSSEPKRTLPLDLKITEFSCQQDRMIGSQAICSAELNERNSRVSCSWINENLYASGSGRVKIEVANPVSALELSKFKVSVNQAKTTQRIRLECQDDKHKHASALTSISIEQPKLKQQEVNYRKP